MQYTVTQAKELDQNPQVKALTLVRSPSGLLEHHWGREGWPGLGHRQSQGRTQGRLGKIRKTPPCPDSGFS